MPRPLAPAGRARIATLAAIVSLSVLAACRSGREPDAYGHVEAVETVVAASSSGILEQLVASEGGRLEAGITAAIVDTTALVLQLEQVAAQRAASAARVREASHQVAALAAQVAVARRGHERTRRLFDQQAATAQQLDQSEREYRTLFAQHAGATAQREGATRDASSSDARVAQIRDLIARSRVRNPVAGTVLTIYARPGEYVQVGQPLYKIADLDTMELRAYVTEPQLALVRIGQRVTVMVDAGDGERRSLPGTVAWVSSQAEFTPTPIQTREERTHLVYAVKVRVPNGDGALKIGMPADVALRAVAASP